MMAECLFWTKYPFKELSIILHETESILGDDLVSLSPKASYTVYITVINHNVLYLCLGDHQRLINKTHFFQHQMCSIILDII